MRNIQKRTLSLLVVIALCLSFVVPAVQTPAAAAVVDVDYKYSNGTTGYIYNWGNRDEVATFLSPNAVSFYQGNGVSYNALAAMAGAENVADVPSTPLFHELQNLMKDNHSHTTSYDETTGLYQYTDCLNNAEDTTKISTFYTGKLVGPAWDSGKTWNREHVWPNSKGLNGKDENDIMMLRPANPSTNSGRGNEAFGISGSYYDPNELGQNVRGDIARVLLYQYVRWGNASKMWGAAGVIESKDVLLDWMVEDPVDTWEMGRNDSVESITGTRNVFVDYPELAFILFGEEVPTNYTSPSNGTSVELELATAQFNENGTVVSVSSAYAGQKITLPGHTGVVLPGYTFAGWVESTVEETTTRPTVYTEGTQYTLTGDTTLYALYSFTTEGEGGSTGGGESGYIKVTDAANITTGQYVMVLPSGHAPTVYDSSKWVLVDQPTIVDNKVTDTKNAVWTLTVSGNSVTLMDANGTYIKPATGNNNGIQTGTYNWELKFENGVANFKGTGSDTNTLAANKSSSYKIRAYKNTTVTNATSYPSAFTLYKLTEVQSGGPATITNYTTSMAPCEHENTENRAKVAAQCEIAGTEAGVFCLDCQTFISGGAEIAALEHDWVAGAITPPTETQQGYTTYTCENNCGQTMQDDFVPALGVTYTVKFSVPAGVAPIAPAQVDGIEGTTLPVPSGTPGSGYQFVGWAEAALEATTAKPAVLGEFYIPTSNITLYAVYTYTVGGSGKTEYTLVTSADQLGLGHEIVIVGVDGTTNYAMSTTQNGNNRGRAEVTVNENTVSWAESAGVQTIILEEGTVEGAYAMNVGTGYLYAASGSNNYLRTQATVDGNASWLITFEEGVPTVKAQGANTRNWLRHNTGNDIFSCYGSGQADVAIYSKGISGVTYYSTLSCTHENAQSIPEVEPECEVNGYEEGVFCEDCQTYISGGDMIPMLGHNMVAGTVVPPTATEQGYTVYNCANGCGKTEQKDYTDPSGELYEVSFEVPTGVTAIDPVNFNSLTGGTLPVAEDITGAHTYVFAGWALEPITEATTTVPVLYTGNYKPTEDITLFAVYTYAVGGGSSTSESWKLVTDAANLAAGDQIAIVGTKENAYYAMGTTQNKNNRASVSATVNTDTHTLTMTDDIQVITVEAGEVENTIALNVGDGYLYAASSGSNYLKTQTTNNANGCWSVEIAATGVATLKAQGENTRNWMRFNSTNNPPIFACYGSGQNDIYLYEKVVNDGSTVYYTSVVSGSTEPEQPPVTPDPDEPAGTELKTGDQVVIFAPAYNKALSATKTGNYNVGVDITVADGTVTGYGETEIWTVTVNDDGTYSFANGGQNIGLASQYTSMNLGTEHDTWELTSLGGELYHVKNVGRGTYMEWYTKYSNWSTYSAATDDQFQLSFYVIGQGILGDDGSAPEQPPVEPDEPEYPEADSTLTIAEAIALGTPMASDSYTPGKYYVTGIITEVYNTTYGNMYIKDEAGNILTVYGTYDATGTNRYDKLETKPVAGDQVTVYGVIGNYGGKPQMKNGWITGHTPGVEEPPAEPVAPEFPVSDKLVTKVADLLPGTYKMAAYIWKNSDGADISAAPFHLWDGTVSSQTPDTSNSDLNTESYSFTNDTLTAAGTDSAVDVVLVAVPGKENTYYVMVGDQYLYSAVKGTNRRLAVGSDPAEWVATDSEKGGIVLSSNGVSLGSANAKYDFLRSYASADTLVSGLYFFTVTVPQPSVPIALKGYNLTLGNSLSINFNVTQEVMDQYEDVYMVFQVEGRDPVKVTEYFVRQNSDTDIRYNFAFDGVSILDLNVPVLATVYGTFNGVEYSYTAKNAVSVLSYCNSKIANGADDSETAGVCANLLKYAIAAEAYMNAQYGTATDGHLVKILTDAQLTAIETYATPDDQVSVEKKSSHTEGTKVKFSNQSLEMVSRITLRYKITILESGLDTSKLTFKVTYTDYNGNAACQDYTFKDLEYDAKTGEYVLSFSGFNATQMKELAKCTIYIDGVEHCYYANSIENYCCTAINSSKQPEVVKYLAKRISLYGDACYAAYGK